MVKFKLAIGIFKIAKFEAICPHREATKLSAVKATITKHKSELGITCTTRFKLLLEH